MAYAKVLKGGERGNIMSEADPIEDVISDDDSEMVTVWAPEPSNDADDCFLQASISGLTTSNLRQRKMFQFLTAWSIRSSVKKRVLSSFEKQQNSADTC